VFCAVTAVTTEAPYTPSAEKVFRSAWMPAPPPESEPAIVTAIALILRLASPGQRPTTWRNCRAAACGSFCADSAEITATPSAPPATTSAALFASIPGDSAIGRSRLRARNAATIRAGPSTPIGGFGLSLRRCRIDAADPDVIELTDRRSVRLRHRLDRLPDDRLWPEQAPRVFDPHIVLSEGARRLLAPPVRCPRDR
jgi:hypothetical protein